MADNGQSASQKEHLATDAVGAVSNRLNSWKEIARYLERQVRTVQLWEKYEGLPIHRHFHARQGRIFAFRAEIEDWLRGRTVDRQSYSAGSIDPRGFEMVNALALSERCEIRAWPCLAKGACGSCRCHLW
jgi:hypothetical protein